MVDRRKTTKERMLCTRFLVKPAISATLGKHRNGLRRETQHKRSLKNCDSNNGIYMHISKHPDHVIAWAKTMFLDYDRNFHASRMDESFYIDIFAKSGTMNLEDGMFKNQCWNAVLPILREEISEKNRK